MSADAELLLKFQSEPSNAIFKEIVHRHGPMVLYTCLRRLGNMHDAEDGAQETFAILARKATEITGSLSGWLHGVAVQTASQMVRTRVRRARREKELATMTRSSGMSPSEESDWKEEIDSALVELPDDLREAVILRYLEGLKHEEVANRTGCPVSTTAWRSDQGLNRLRSIMARRGVMLSVGSLAALLLLEAEAMAATTSAVLATMSAAAGKGTISGGSTTGVLAKLGSLKAAGIAVTTVAVAGIAASVAVWSGSANPSVPNKGVVISQPAAILETGKAGARGHTFVLTDDLLATGNSDNTIDVWEVSKARQVFRLGGNPDDCAIALAGFPKDSILATAASSGVVKLWNLQTREEVATLPSQPRPILVNSLAFSADGKLLASGIWNDAIMVYDVAARKERYTIRGEHGDGVMTVRFAPDGKLLFAGSWNGIITVRDAESGKSLQKLTAHAAGGWIGLAVSPQGVLASGGNDSQVKIWSWADGKVQRSMQGHTAPVFSVCWSPDGKLLASGSKDGTAKLWNAADGRLLATYICEDQGLDVQFTADGKSLVTGGWNTPLKVWTVVLTDS
jgi:RNA polymerase sigma factor (sigma-70 family)